MSPQQPPKGLRWLVWARHGSGWAAVSSILVYVGLRGPTKRLYRVSVTVKDQIPGLLDKDTLDTKDVSM